MNAATENPQNYRFKFWGGSFLLSVILIIIGYKSPATWLSVSVTVWAVYLITYVTSPLLIAASQNTGLAKAAKLTLSVLGTIAAAAIISAPIVLLHWYKIA